MKSPIHNDMDLVMVLLSMKLYRKFLFLYCILHTGCKHTDVRLYTAVYVIVGLQIETKDLIENTNIKHKQQK